MIDLVLASRNKKKLQEMSELLAELGINVKSIDEFSQIPEIKETGTTFHENARIKAETVSNMVGKLALADDSGLEVDALGGRPGVYSARYAGESASDNDNIDKLLKELENVPFEKRTARFICVIAISHPSLETKFMEGSCEGYIIKQRRGNKGFGYDPVFYYPQMGKTFAELPSIKKAEVSHRGEALDKAKNIIKGLVEELEV